MEGKNIRKRDRITSEEMIINKRRKTDNSTNSMYWLEWRIQERMTKDIDYSNMD